MPREYAHARSTTNCTQIMMSPGARTLLSALLPLEKPVETVLIGVLKRWGPFSTLFITVFERQGAFKRLSHALFNRTPQSKRFCTPSAVTNASQNAFERHFRFEEVV